MDPFDPQIHKTECPHCHQIIEGTDLQIVNHISVCQEEHEVDDDDDYFDNFTGDDPLYPL